MRKTKLAYLSLITSVFLLTACGQKGALYIPAEAVTTPTAEMTEITETTETLAEEEAEKKAVE